MTYMLGIKRLVVHHSGSPRSQSVDAIKRYHTSPEPFGKGWPDIAYHHIIDDHGVVHPGRPLFLRGFHVKGLNSISIGVCLIGNNLDPDERWNQAQITSLRRYMAAWRLLVPSIEVVGHHEVGQTNCPGIGHEVLVALMQGESLLQGAT